MTVTIHDDGGNAVPGVSCAFTVLSEPGTDASVGSQPLKTDASGQVTATLHTGSSAGTVKVSAQCGAVTQVLDVNVTSPPASLPDTGMVPARTTGGPALEILMLVLLLSPLGLAAANVVRGLRRSV